MVENDEKVGKRNERGQLRQDWSLSGEWSELVVRLRLGKDTDIASGRGEIPRDSVQD